MPIRVYKNWNIRSSDTIEQIEPYRKYYFICEGANTEVFYFQHLIDIRKKLGIRPVIDIRLMEKTDADKDISYPKALIDYANTQKKNPDLDFDPDHDKMIVVFDADIFENRVENYDEVVRLGEESNILGITNPAFELFLLLHIEGSWEKDILPNKDLFLLPDNMKGRNSLAYRLLHDETGMNSKKNREIGMLADNVLTAIRQEKNINEDIHKCKGQLTCNLGKIIQMIIDDTGEEEPRQFEHRSSEENAIPEEDDILLAVAAKRLKDADLTKAIPEAEAYKELGIKPGDLAGTEETDIE